MPQTPPISGVIPAVLLPRDLSGAVLWDAFDRSIRFLAEFAISGLCLNGATGEYPSATAEERRETVVRARQVLGDSRLVVSAVGSAHWLETLRFAREAEDAGAGALLVPAPHFFLYEQSDLSEFFRQVVPKLHVPALLYNLSAFTGEIQPPLALELLRDLPGLAGIKDSSGSLAILEALTANPSLGAVRLVGHDGVLAEAVARHLCDGTISGIAGVLPELTLAISQGRATHHLATLLDQLAPLPIPWGLKAIAESRGLAPANYALPLSAQRRDQLTRFQSWFAPWWEAALRDLQ
jgi:4-hydroxy-tetrahydrodipicolinate synthase